VERRTGVVGLRVDQPEPKRRRQAVEEREPVPEEVIERPRRLVLASTETRLDGSSLHTTLEFTFEARGAKTLMTMIQHGFPTVELRDEHRRGVPNAFARLERLVARHGRFE
jgi:uncharacterized protein YndB with AHSA1/START domain